LRSILTIIGCASTPFTGPAGAAACGAISGIITIAAGGSIADGLKAFAFAFISAGVWDAVGGVLNDAREALGAAFGIVKAGVHGIIGGALSVAQGGSFLQGFASNALGALGGFAGEEAFGPARTGGFEAALGRTLIAAAAGCGGAVITGGKCAEGAVTAAFAHMYNAEGGLLSWLIGDAEAAPRKGFIKGIDETKWIDPATGKYRYIDPITNKLTVASDADQGTMAGDHLLPKSRFPSIGNFAAAPPEVRDALLWDKDNLMPLPRHLNSSKGAIIETGTSGWDEYKTGGQAIHPAFKQWLLNQQRGFEQKIINTTRQYKK
jgi:hypothetical protein